MHDIKNECVIDEVIIDPKRANFEAFTLMIPLAILVFTPYYLIWRTSFTYETLREFAKDSQSWMNTGTFVIMALIIAGIILHELIHAITWGLFAKEGFKVIEFGILWRELTPYSHCKEPLPIKQYITGMITPALLLGIIPGLLSYVAGNFWLMIFGAFFTAAAAGDLMILRTLKDRNTQDFIRDHPTAIGYQIFRKPQA